MQNEWVDFKAVKAAVSMEQVLARYGVKLRRVNAHYLRGRCPLPTHTSEKSRESFGVDTSKNAWACQSGSCVKARGGRKGGNVLDFVAVMENSSVRDAAARLQNWFGVSAAPPEKKPPAPAYSGQPKQRVAKEKQGAPEREETEPATEGQASGEGESAEANKPLGFALKGIDSSHPYLAKRGIRKETAEYFGVGFFPGRGSMSGRLVIPIEDENGELVAYAGRAIDGSEPKYKLPAGFKKSQVVFNLRRACEADSTGAVVVVEGFFDCMKVTQAGHVCVALMGCSLSREQHELLCQHFRQVVLMLDGDEAGRAATREIAARLMYSHFVRAASLGSGVQPDMLSSENIRAALGG